MKKKMPKIKKALDAANVPTTAWLPQWILTLFAKQMGLIKPAAVQRIWNNIFKDGWWVGGMVLFAWFCPSVSQLAG